MTRLYAATAFLKEWADEEVNVTSGPFSCEKKKKTQNKPTPKHFNKTAREKKQIKTSSL